MFEHNTVVKIDVIYKKCGKFHMFCYKYVSGYFRRYLYSNKEIN